MKSIIDKNLRKAVRENNLIVFVGAGLAKYLNLPTWKEFTITALDKLSKEKGGRFKKTYNKLKSDVESGKIKPNTALNKIEKEHQKDVLEYIQTEFKLNAGTNCKYHEKILCITEKVITSNFDNAFETAYENLFGGKRHCLVVNGALDNNDILLNQIKSSSKSKSFIFKIHGCSNQPNSCIVFNDQYKKFYKENNRARSILEEFARNSTMLFIGWSFSDTNTKKLFETHCKGLFNKHYILTTNPSKYSKKNYLKPLKISNYDEESINGFLDELSRCNRSKVGEIRNVGVFKNISEKAIKIIADEAPRLILKKNDFLVNKGDAANDFWIILKGRLEIISESAPSIVRKEDDIVGELGFVLQMDRQRTMVSLDDYTEVLTVSRSIMEHLPKKDENMIWRNVVCQLVKKKAEDETDPYDEIDALKDIARHLSGKLRIK